jgi:ATP-binding cassette subfamily B protein
MRRYWLLLAGAGICLLLSVIAAVAVPQVMRVIINDIVASTRQQQFGVVGALMILGLGIVRSLASYFQGYLTQIASEGLVFDLRQALFKKLHELGYNYHNTAQTGQLITIMTSDIDIVGGAGSAIGLIIYTVLVTAVSAVILFAMNWQLAIVTLVVLPIIVFVLYRFQKRMPPLYRDAAQRTGMLTALVEEVVRNIRLVHVFGREAYQLERFKGVVQGTFDAAMRIIRVIGLYVPTIQLFALAATAIVIGVGGYQVIAGNLSLGELVAFSTYVNILLAPIYSVVAVVGTLSRSAASAKRLDEVLSLPLDLPERPGAPDLPPVQGWISIENVAVRFPNHEADTLTGISFTVQPGQFVSIVGPTGCGKTALIYLIPRFYDPVAGRVTIDGHDLREVSVASLRRQVGLAPQTVLLFSGTVRENIAFGRPDATLDEVREAAHIAQADKFIETFPLGYETKLGEAGAGLSGGQQQRVALARALVHRPPILILDDSMSSLDAGTKRQVLQELRNLPWTCTRIVVGDLEAVGEADLVLVMDQGRIVASGRHQELLLSNQIYQNLLAPKGSEEVVMA